MANEKIQSAAHKDILRIAAYCRVSTEMDEQTDSFELQERHYTKLIRNKPGWKLAGIYSDQGISGTQRKNRPSFQRMMRHCEEGKIDRILCKSISRFARNTVDMLNAVRFLKEHKISVFFEKENIDTLSVQSEFILSTISAIAQEESRSISENMQWSIKKRFERGEPLFRRIMGYNIQQENGKKIITINDEEAKTVREIYSFALDGFGTTAIMKKLIMLKRKTIKGNFEWSIGKVSGILTNERYTGDVICQKTYTVDFLSHNMKRNNGEVTKYLIENYHAAIIDKETFLKVQELISLNTTRVTVRNRYPLSSRFICGNCGVNLHRFNASSYPKWKCSRHKKSIHFCSTEDIFESSVETAMKKAFLEKYNPTKENYINILTFKLKQMQDYDNVERDRVIIKREIIQALRNETNALNLNTANSIVARKELEQQLNDKEELWKLLEEDRRFRQNTIHWLENLPDGESKIQSFLRELNIEYLRAWVISIKLQSPFSFFLRWSDNSETVVTIDETNGDYR